MVVVWCDVVTDDSLATCWLEVMESVVAELLGRLLEIIVTNASIIHLGPSQHPPRPGQAFLLKFGKFNGISAAVWLFLWDIPPVTSLAKVWKLPLWSVRGAPSNPVFDSGRCNGFSKLISNTELELVLAAGSVSILHRWIVNSLLFLRTIFG